MSDIVTYNGDNQFDEETGNYKTTNTLLSHVYRRLMSARGKWLANPSEENFGCEIWNQLPMKKTKNTISLMKQYIEEALKDLVESKKIEIIDLQFNLNKRDKISFRLLIYDLTIKEDLELYIEYPLA